VLIQKTLADKFLFNLYIFIQKILYVQNKQVPADKFRPRIFSAAEIFLEPLLRFAAEISAGWQHWLRREFRNHPMNIRIFAAAIHCNTDVKYES
jgi:hypothetical protein